MLVASRPSTGEYAAHECADRERDEELDQDQGRLDL